MTTFLLLLKCFFQSILSTLLRVVLPSVTMLLLKFCFKILFIPLSKRSEYAATDSPTSTESGIKNENILLQCYDEVRTARTLETSFRI